MSYIIKFLLAKIPIFFYFDCEFVQVFFYKFSIKFLSHFSLIMKILCAPLQYISLKVMYKLHLSAVYKPFVIINKNQVSRNKKESMKKNAR